MTETEINEAVGRKLGWRYSGVGTLFHPPNPPIPERPSAFQLPDYSGSIEAAWEIVETLPDVAIYKWPQGGFAVSVPQVGEDGKLSNSIGIQANADTAPLAICMAFLKLP